MHPPCVVSTTITRSPVLPPCAEGVPSTALSPCAPVNRKWVLVATILGSALAFMDGSVVNVALPTLQSAFGATAGSIQWVIQGYALFSAALLLLGGAIGDHYGRRRTYMWGVAVFALASAGCALAQSLGQLIVARAAQGVGAALLIPQGLSIISASFPADERGKAIGTWSAWTGVCAALGPVVGGWLLQAWSWRLIFILNLPLAALVIALAPRIPESRASGDAGAQPLDRLGATLATLGFAGVIFALSFAPQFGWRNALVALPMLAGVVLLAGFLYSQAIRANAMMPLALFRIPRFLAANLLTLLLYGALYGGFYVIPFYVIQVRHYSPAAAGAVFLPLIALMFLFSARVGALVPRINERFFLIAGPVLAGVGFALLALLDRQAGYVFSILPGVLVLGMGLTLTVAPLSTTVMSSVPQSRIGVASAVNNAISRLAGLVAVSVLVLVLAHGFGRALDRQLAHSGLPDAARAQMIANRARLHDTPVPADLTSAQHKEAERLLDESFLSGFRNVMLSSMLGAWLGAVTVLLLLRGGRASGGESDLKAKAA